MSQESRSIVCRRCGEVIPLESESCPHCGKDVRGVLGPAIAIGLGLILVVSAVLAGPILYVFGAVGVIMAASGGYILYDRRQRIQEATGRSSSEPGEASEEEESIF